MKNVLLALTGTLMFMSCSKDIIVGNDHKISETRTVNSFTSVAVAGDFNVKISKGDTIQLKVTAPSNIMPLLDTRVDGQTLEIDYKYGNNVVRGHSDIFITLPDLKGITFYGDANIATTGSFSGQLLKLTAVGNGKIETSAGSYDKIKIINTGNGVVEAFETSAKTAEVLVNGNSKTALKVLDELSVRLQGNGRVYYKGNPTLDILINGNGKVIKR